MGARGQRARTTLLSVLLLVPAVCSCAGGSTPRAVPVARTDGRSAPAPSSLDPTGPVCTDSGPVTVAGDPKPAPTEIVRTSDPLNTLGGAELLPSAFPVPPGFSVGQVARIADVSITGEILPGDVNAAYTYLLTALPAAGYRITGCGTSPAVAAIQFLGHECTGQDTEVVLSPSSSSVLCELGT